MALKAVVTERVHASPEAVFAAASDFANAPQRIRGIKKMEMLTSGPVGVGTRFRETRVMFGKEASETMEVVEFVPGRSYTLYARNMGCDYRTTVSVRPAVPAGMTPSSDVTFDFSSTPLSTGAKIMGALMGWMVKGACLKAIRADLKDLKAAVENPSRASASTPTG